MFNFLMPGYLGGIDSFEQNIARPVRSSRANLVEALSKSKTEGSEIVDEEEDLEDVNIPSSRKHAKNELDEMEAKSALSSLHRRILPFLLRRLKSQVLNDLPPKIIQDLIVPMSIQQEKLYSLLFSDVKSKLVGESPSGNKDSLGQFSRLMMTCTHPLLSLRNIEKHATNRLEKRKVQSQIASVKEAGVAASSKFQALDELLLNHLVRGDDGRLSDGMMERKEKTKALCFAQYQGTLDIIEEQVLFKYTGLKHLRLDGTVKPHDRQAIVNRFNEDSTIDLLLLTTKVGGQGLNLTAANLVIFMEHDWNPMNDLQAMDRAHRLGQSRCVNVIRILTKDTLEERLMCLQTFKMNMAAEIVNEENTNVEALRTDQIFDMLVPKESQLPINKAGLSSILKQVGELWGEEQYDSFSVSNFAKLLNSK